MRNYLLLAHLARRHTIDLLTFQAPGDALPPDSPLYRHCQRIGAVARSLHAQQRRRLCTLFTSPLPDMAYRLEAPAMHQLVQSWLQDTSYDIVQIEGIELAQYARHVAHTRSALLFDDHNCEYLLQQRNALTDLRHPQRWHAAAYSLIQWAKLRRYEAAICHRADAVVAVSQPDRIALKRIAPEASIHVAPNGIELESYAGSDGEVTNSTNRFTLLFTGKMDYRPNIDAVLWFAEQVLPHISSVAPEVHFQIVGSNPHPRLDVLRRLAQIEITGAVPSIPPFLNAADAFVIPMRVGGGTRFKALEAMAARKAIVSTTLGVEGIGVQSEREMLIADSPAAFAAAILRLIADKRDGAPLAQRLGQAAFELVVEEYSWERIVPIFDRLYAQLQPGNIPTKQRPLDPLASEANHDQTGSKP